MRSSLFANCLLMIFFAASLQAAPPHVEMDYGLFLAGTIVAPQPADNTVLKGVAVRLTAPGVDESQTAAALFDTENCRYAAWWSGGFLSLQGVAFDGEHGKNPSVKGTQAMGTKPSTGVEPQPNSKDAPAKYLGLYRHQQGTIFSYTAAGRHVLDMPGVEVLGNQLVFTRTIHISPGAEPLTLVVADIATGKPIEGRKDLGVSTQGDESTVVRTLGGELAFQPEGRWVLIVPPQASRIKLLMAHGPEQQTLAIGEMKTAAPIDLVPLTKGSAPLWKETVVTQGQLAKEDDDANAYLVDSLTLPMQNPYKSWMRVGGFDFLPDGRAALSTWSGDVWLCSGIDDQLQMLTWKRYATGLFQPLGLKVVDGAIYTLGRDQITRLHDLNDDDEADYYECFNNDVVITPNFHEFAYDLHTDAEGNFYFIKGGPVRPGGSGWDKIVTHHGSLMKVSPDGKSLEVVARGFRAPNGMGLGPKGELTSGDNEGTWTPAVPLNWIKPGGFYGVPDFSAVEPWPQVRENPLCWMPKEIDNSNGGQVWITGNKFGPLSGQLLHTSYGTCTLFSVLKEEVGGQMQGGVVALPVKFDSGICRARFRAEDNSLYLTGLRGWQSRATKDGGFYRLRYTGRPYLLPTALHASADGLTLTFAEPLDRKAAEDIDNYNIEQWNYRWMKSYGSLHWKTSNPKEQGHDEVEIDEAKLSADGKTVTLKITDLAPVMQMKTSFTLKAADGSPLESEIHHTINAVGDLVGEVHIGEYKIIEK